MSQEFDEARDVYLDRDDAGIVRQLIHVDAPVLTEAQEPQLAAAEYLRQYGELLGIPDDQLQNLDARPSERVEDIPVEYRLLEEKRQFDTATVAYYETALGLPVWQAGLAVQMTLAPTSVVIAQSTTHVNLEVEIPSSDATQHAASLSEREFGPLLGLDQQGPDMDWNPESLEIQTRELVVLRYEPEQRVQSGSTEGGEKNGRQPGDFVAGIPTLPMPPVPEQILSGRHYVCVKMDFSLSGRRLNLLNWVAIVEVETLAVLYLRAFIDHVNGRVFERDPSTSSGGPLPNANNATLNPLRTFVPLPGLSPAVGGTQSLTGDFIQLSDFETPTIAAPTESTGVNFDFDARTNNFAAVNAYYHCDRFLRMLDGMGLTRPLYLGDTTFPTPVDHRGRFGTGNGIEINAYCQGNSGGKGILQTAFMLADLSDTANPLGLACDYRVVLHELGGHGVLYNHVSSANFGFAHSAGDSVAAILNDPESQAADRFLTFPWVSGVIARRHDRTPAGGWGYGGSIARNPFDGTLDSGGYNNEQILSSAHFRAYRSIGGDSQSVATRRFAARMASYLILRGIATLSPATNPTNATGWVTALLAADAGDWVTENITGGAYGKVIRWAFEQQGLFQSAGTPTPNNLIGAPPAVDVYIDDGRGGEYPFQPVHWNCKSIWNRRANDGGTTYEEPITNQTNYAYVKIKNRGTQAATNVIVKAYHANPAAGLLFPIDWFPMNTPQLAAANVPANNGGEIIVGPFEWVPTHVGHECIFMVVSATGDASNTSKIKAGSAIPEWRLVPNDNNIGQRNVFPISGGGTSGLVESFNQLQLQLKNPSSATEQMEVQFFFPEFLARREWRGVLPGIDEMPFLMEPGESRDVSLALVPGGDFSAEDVAKSQDRIIQVIGYAGGIAIGGMSYELQPYLAPGAPADEQDADQRAFH